ncbi:hypothetical protein PHYBLDRAFT_70948 [Phycomyces blakesleeanus NRRL 1555(-)]|uniref:Uncharacterized protein n=1 Tax=Phycomyces blakesleeanus (strain ATCC 8743b / DSM 1359 / FGSC 10004 / NBRC 33097 / NRRL 1555) TaxID=763407 RepID=A0A162ZEK2_PHYB8|nr:hypothetical protein PHYBLDRAFT_70948 [Phycomyces blakesleeanus NRRL 1555(-)]OAD66221.1 hypothetical protein PHYBLDRAFT_70948 [Phycomyces blakesleeanus NRRL 1555(-)]|eukprot:XP_018284261.1 hypothetical protein PHYBLDRAFT_70948 [Phycomyces blakesleeanus NRRL 1555(-)]
MTLDYKYNLKDMIIKKDFKNMSTDITLPILANNSIRTISILNYLLNKNNVHKCFICLADNNIQIKRISTCVISVTCNSKTIQRKFKVMNLTNSHEYDFSIDTDYMSSLSIGIYGLSLSYDNADSSEKHNHNIPKGSFCTISESVVCLDTSENATMFRSPYLISYKMQDVVDKQVKE